MKPTPLVTIFIPTYNRFQYLDDCLYSLVNQDFHDYEIFIRDNDSKDETFSVVKKYEKEFKHIFNFRYIKNSSNVGFRDNMVYGLRECKGKYTIILMDDDFLSCKTSLSSFVRALEATEKTSLAVAPISNYFEGKMTSTPKEIIDQGNQNIAYADFKTVPGNDYFLNSWTKYGPICLSSTMFDTEKLLNSPWAQWSERAGLDVNIYHLLSLNNEVAVLKNAVSYYRRHSSNDIFSFPVEDSMDSHSHIKKWYQFAMENSKIPRWSLIVWRIKTVILKDDGVIRWLSNRKPPVLNKFLQWLRKYNYFHYLLLKYLNPQMIQYAKEVKGNCWSVRIRKKISNFLISTDKWFHDPEIRNKRLSVKKRKRDLALYNKASLLEKKDSKDAEYLFKQIFKTSDETDLRSGALYHLGEMKYKEAKYLSAHRYFKLCLKINPEHKKAGEYTNIINKTGNEACMKRRMEK